MTTTSTTDVLTVGAGPAGTSLALDLARRGVAVRLSDKAPHAFEGSRTSAPRSFRQRDPRRYMPTSSYWQCHSTRSKAWSVRLTTGAGAYSSTLPTQSTT